MPSYLPFLLIALVVLAGLPVSASVTSSWVQSAHSTYGTIPQPSLQNRNASTIGLASAPIPELSWTEGQPFPTFDGLIIFPSLAPNLPGSLSTQNYATHWYAGSVYPSGLPTQNAVTVYTTINVPSSAPLSDEFYYVLLSAWDSAGSYDQIGFSDTWGTWGLAYSWTSGPPSNPTYHYSSNAMALSLGVPYTFYITTQSGVTHFTAYQGSSLAWSLDAPTGGNYLVLSYSYSGYYDYTDYEEIWYTSTSGGAPAFSFYFYNNYWINTDGGSNAATWQTWTSSGTPSNVAVVISGNSVLVINPTVTVTVAVSPSVYDLNLMSIWVDGSPTTTPKTYTWVVGSTHTLTAASPVIIIGEQYRYVFVSWSDGGAQSHTITTPFSDTYTANYKTQYYLSVASAYDSPSPTSDWFDAGTPITASVTSPVSGGTGTQYLCTGWTGSGSVPSTGSACSVGFNMNAPSSITWNWKTQYQLTMQVNPSGGGTTSPAVGSDWYDLGSSVPISATANSGYFFSFWSGSGSGSYTGSNNLTSVTTNGPITETANFFIPTITVSPASAPPGYGTLDGTVGVSGQGFTSGTARACQLTSTPTGLFATSPPLTCSISSSGIVTGSFAVSPTASPSSYVVRVTDTNSAGVFAETGFTVLAAPTLAASPASGPIVTTVTLTNLVPFAVQDVGGCVITSSPVGLISSPICSIDSAGNLASASFVVSSSAPGGINSLTVTGLHGDSASTSFTVTPVIALSPTSGSPPLSALPGTQVTVTGAGFKPSGVCTIAVNPPPPAGFKLVIDSPTCTVSSSGVLTSSFKVGAGSTWGLAYSVQVTGPGGDSAAAFLAVSARIVLTPNSGSSGVLVSVKGSGFSASAGSCSLTGTPVGGGSTCAQAGDGTVAGQFSVATVPTGSYSITVNDVAGAPSASAPFTVNPGPIVNLSPNSGPTGTTVIVSGSGWNVADTFVTFANAGLFDGTKTCAVSGGTIASGCSFTVKLTALGGIWTVTSTGTQGDNSQAQFTVQSSFIMNPNNGGPGTTGTFSGSGYTTSVADCSGDISASPPLLSSSTCAVDSNGILSGTFTVDASASPGLYTVTISGAEVQQGSISVTFTVMNPQVTFETNPASSALIHWGSCSGPGYGNGQSLYSTDYGSVTACYVPSGYSFDSWSCSGGLACSASRNPTVVTFAGPGAITLNFKTGSLPNPVSSSLTASASPANPVHGTSFTVSGTLTANGVGLGGEQVLLVFGNGNVVAVTTQTDGSYSYIATAPVQAGVYDVEVFFLGNYSGGSQYLPCTASASVSVG